MVENGQGGDPMIKPIKRTRRVLELPVADIRPNPMQPRRAFRQPELQ